MARRRLPALDPADRALWDALKTEVRPLSANVPSRDAPMHPLKVDKPAQKSTPPSLPSSPPPDLIWQAPGSFAVTLNTAPRSRTGSPSDLRGGGSRGLDRAGAERLRKGKMPIEGRLDLHGLTQAQAHARLEQFILTAAAAGKRHLLVITGKGLSKGGLGVLRTRVPEWLGQGALAGCVLAFSYAQKRDGEQGALYVLLRRGHG